MCVCVCVCVCVCQDIYIVLVYALRGVYGVLLLCIHVCVGCPVWVGVVGLLSFLSFLASVLLVECYALLASGECARKIRSTYNVTVCAVPVTYIYIYIYIYIYKNI